MPNKKKNQPAPIVLEAHGEDEAYLLNVKNAQQTLADKLWFFFEYKSKNDLNLYAGDYPEEERKKYGYNSSGAVSQREEDIERSFRHEARDIAAAGTIDDYKTYFRTLGSMKIRTVTISGKYFDQIQKAIDEKDPYRDQKSYYLFSRSGLSGRASTCYDFCDIARTDADIAVRKVLEKKFDYKTVTYRQFAESMGIDYDKMDIPEGDDNIYKNILSHHTMEVKESDLRFEVYNTLSTAFANYFVLQGEDAETEKMTEEQKRLFRQGQTAGQRAENVSDEGIEQWIASEGEQLGDELLLATRISNVKDARYRTHFAGSFGCDSDGFLEAELKKEAARTRFIGDIVGKKKNFEQVKEGIINRANKKYYAESLRKYRDETPARASYDNYLILHTGIKAGNTPDEMVDSLSKSLAACALIELDRSFSLKDARKVAQHYKELFALDTLKNRPDLLKSALQDSSSVLKMGRELKKTFYGVTPDRQQAFSDKMRMLQSHLLSPEKRSKEYKKFYEAVKICAELAEKMDGKSPEEKEMAFCQANLNVFEAARQYMNGKESVRTRNTGKLSFDHALDAIAICSETNPSLNVRADQIIGSINRVRNQNNPLAANYINADSFHQHYGANHSLRNVADYSGRNRNVNIVNDPANDMNAPRISGQ